MRTLYVDLIACWFKRGASCLARAPDHQLTGESMRQTIGTTRRSFLGQAAAGSLAIVSGSAWVSSARAEARVDLPLPQGPTARVVTTSFPQKAPMILQRTRRPLPEAPFEGCDHGVL